MTRPLNVLSTFSGVGCFDLAFQRAGHRVVAACEKDPTARGVLRHRWPGLPIYPDITELTSARLAADGVPRPDVVVGGWPCQDLSVAGRRAGLAGARSGLWWHLLRLVDEVRPRWLVGENVPGLLSSNCGRDMGTVIGSLAELGYGLAWRVLDAQHFGVPQRRRRVFLVGCVGDGAAPAAVLFEPEGSAGDPTAGGATGAGVARGARAGAADAGHLAGTLTTEGQRRASSAEAVETLIPVLVGTLGTTGPGGGWRIGADEAAAGQVVVEPTPSVRRLTPRECERLQGLPNDHTRWSVNAKGVTVEQADSLRYRQCGNGGAVPVMQWIAERLPVADAIVAEVAA